MKSYKTPDNFDCHQYWYWSKWNLIRTSYFQSVHVLILAQPIFLWKLILVFKTGHLLLSSCTVGSPINENVDVPIYKNACRQEYLNTDDCFIAICKHLYASKSEKFLFSVFYIDWFIRNCKDQTDSKLPKSGLCALIILKTHVLQWRHGKGTHLNIGEFLLRQK